MEYEYKFVDSPVRRLQLVARRDKLVAILWENDRPNRVKLGTLRENDAHPVLVETARQLDEYFSGQRTHFDIDLQFEGTDFQKRVWAALLTIPYGETRSYLEIAEQIGNPNAVRAVGAANGRNPISIIAPCHRVIGSSGTLTGFAGGLAAKERLLRIEATSVRSAEYAQPAMTRAYWTRAASSHQRSLFDAL
ncbi:methylated-DNA--[protein]-cysteine S-methyltransferase [Paraburkholderia sp. Cpub6]|uniref:methylated-DNA--[protein]-cysteine S-methyltransferase n=1 Tax=Paraburkholderia sp. Cpub6 TaxID=2723094 RepID=UPI0016089913|nr:methylated-DNA--[protein]-cysteine S-methyltransferase [Paraburkholderia sp. Cpub6]MBB5460181.1 methylated-DNA-[protein]-cysteine S-methyltransferase [Paraburkholderia sp. Cpub6]